MNEKMVQESVDLHDAGGRMHRFVADLYPICRSITGDGIRETLRRVRTHIPLEIHEVPTGARVFDWTVPREWNIRDAWVKDPRGEKVIDFQKSNLHVVNYCVPILRPHASARNCAADCTLCPSIPTGFPIARLTTRRRGAFAWHTAGSNSFRRASTRSASTPVSRTGR